MLPTALASTDQGSVRSEMVLRLFGEAVDPRDAENLAVALLADGRPDAVSTAAALDSAFPDEVSGVQLTAAQRETVAHVVEHHTRSLSKLQSLLQANAAHAG